MRRQVIRNFGCGAILQPESGAIIGFHQDIRYIFPKGAKFGWCRKDENFSRKNRRIKNVKG
jgi:hypothetical protein